MTAAHEPSGAFVNLRSLGGIPGHGGRTIRPGVLYRSDAPAAVDDRLLAWLREDLRLRTIVDLRSPEEVYEDAATSGLPGIAWVHVPIIGSINPGSGLRTAPPSMQDLMLWLAVDRGHQVGAALRIVMAAAQEPVLFHCAGGKDRTGILAAILLGVLGAPDPEICADYARSEDVVGALMERTTPEARERIGEIPPDYLTASPSAMATFLADLRHRFGSLDRYALATGLTQRELDAFRELMLD